MNKTAIKSQKKSTNIKLLISVFVIESPPLQTTLVGMGSAAVTTLLAPEIKVRLKTSYSNIRGRFSTSLKISVILKKSDLL